MSDGNLSPALWLQALGPACALEPLSSPLLAEKDHREARVVSWPERLWDGEQETCAVTGLAVGCGSAAVPHTA